jgi:hypothetical protein
MWINPLHFLIGSIYKLSNNLSTMKPLTFATILATFHTRVMNILMFSTKKSHPSLRVGLISSWQMDTTTNFLKRSYNTSSNTFNLQIKVGDISFFQLVYCDFNIWKIPNHLTTFIAHNTPTHYLGFSFWLHLYFYYPIIPRRPLPNITT